MLHFVHIFQERSFVVGPGPSPVQKGQYITALFEKDCKKFLQSRFFAWGLFWFYGNQFSQF